MAISDTRRCRSCQAKPGHRRVVTRLATRMPSTVVAVRSTTATSPVARVAYHRTGELMAGPRRARRPATRGPANRSGHDRAVVADQPGRLPKGGELPSGAAPHTTAAVVSALASTQLSPDARRAPIGSAHSPRWWGRRCGAARPPSPPGPHRRARRGDDADLIATTWSTSATGVEESVAIPTGPTVGRGAVPAVATSPPMLTGPP